MSEKIWKVAVLGAAGRMGSEAVRAVNTAEDMDLVAALGRGDDLQELVDSGAEIVIDLTVPDSSEANVRFAVEHGMHAVVGTTGWTPERLDSLRELLGEHPGVGVLIAPNFAIGSILATEFAAKAARYFDSVEIIEIHHPNKVDAPSGTAVHTARKVAAARAEAGVGPSPDATTSDPLGSRGAVVDGTSARNGGSPGDSAGRPRPAAGDSPRFLRPRLIHARRAAGCARGGGASGPERGPGRLHGPVLGGHDV